MISVLFVCLGNICRSPMAELIFKKMVEERGLALSFEISSRGTSDEEEATLCTRLRRAYFANTA